MNVAFAKTNAYTINSKIWLWDENHGADTTGWANIAEAATNSITANTYNQIVKGWVKSTSATDTETGYFPLRCQWTAETADTTTTGCSWKTLATNGIWYSIGDGTSDWQIHKYLPTPQERLRDIIRKRHAPGIIVVESKRPMSPTPDIREQRARETLCRLIGQERFMRFLKQGFISARNRRSGKVYQIFPGHGITRVFENGNLIARLCVVLKGDFPPTDSIIVRYLMALNDEEQLWALAIKHSIKTSIAPVVAADVRPLPQILAELREQHKKVA